jgi:capsule polysaccharide export protein KpsE/RkpR
MEQSLSTQPSLPKSDDEEISLLDIAAVLWKRRKFILVFTILIAVLVTGLMVVSKLLPPEKSFFPNRYAPQAMVLIGSPSSASSLSSSLGSLAGLAGISAGGNTNGALAVALATSNSTLDAIIEKVDLRSRIHTKKLLTQEDLRRSIKPHLKAKYDSTTNILTLSYEDIDPVFARDVVNNEVNILLDRFMSLSGTKAGAQRDLLEKKLIDVKASIDSMESQVKQFQAKYGVMDVEALAKEQVTVIAQIRSQLILKEIEIDNYKKVSSIDDPQLKNLQGERDSIASKIQELERGKGNNSTGAMMPSQREMPSIAFEYQKLERDMLVQTEVYKLLTQQSELAKLNATGQDPVFQVLELAETPEKNYGTSRAMVIIVSTFAAFFIAILWVFVRNAWVAMKSDSAVMAKFRS